LIGLPWRYGINDCFSLVRRYYALAGVLLPDFERPERLETSPSIFLEQASALGFRETALSDLRADDVLIMRLGTDAPMHAAIYIGDQQILHQRMNSVSGVEALTRYYRMKTAAVFRYAADGKAA
tara:strand:+ start:1284 stop:1655 length:372 start_codon:yes stop_codon:yes gene_type:complete